MRRLTLSAMAYTESTRRKRAKAREAAQEIRRQRLEDEKANLRALNVFFDAKYRLAKVELWLDDRIAELHAKADTRRTIHQQEAANALAGMIARGMTVEKIARMAGMTAQTVERYLTDTPETALPATPAVAAPRPPACP